ncbi:MAG: SRPBCC family protein [Gaiellaceae bacterium]|nr:SRPBCC family protein [Actinomycetota bacterium]
MKTIEESIEIDVPVSTAYNQWTQFESFPQFMEGVERVEQKDDKHLRWVAEIGGETREWNAEITEQHPDHRVAWKALDQAGPNGVVTFHKLSDSQTKIMVQMEYEPEGMKESVGSAVGLDSRRVQNDLESFKEFIESRGSETGAWRGDVEN